jgi:hypothetical protein
MNLKVQILGKLTGASFIGGGDLLNPLTFHAFSSVMQHRVLQLYVDPANEGLIAISETNEAPKVGEWHEELAPNAILNTRVSSIASALNKTLKNI